MSPVIVTARRTLSALRNRFSAVLVMSVFLAMTAIRFSFVLDGAEGSSLPLAAIWAGCVAPLLPVVAAFFAMDVWSEELRTGNIEALLSIAVRERDLVIGKAVGVWLWIQCVVLLVAVSSVGLLVLFSSGEFNGLGFASFLPAFGILAVQSALWTSVTVMVSAFFRHGIASAAVSLFLVVGLPRGLWEAMRSFSTEARTAFGVFPLDAQVEDVAAGTLSCGALAGYVFATFAALLIASKAVSSFRFSGRGGIRGRCSAVFVMLLAVVAAWLLTALALRVDVVLDLPVRNNDELSQRTRHVLSENSGRVNAVCFMPQNDPAFRSVAHLLRLIKARADSFGSVSMGLSFVDPRWEIRAAANLVGQKTPERAVVFSCGNRRVELLVSEGVDERKVVSAISRVIRNPQRRDVYWTYGHGELDLEDYGHWGMSDIARELTLEGYRNRKIDLSSDASIPPDCALIVVAGAKQDFSRSEISRLGAYLKNGGRLLVLVSPPGKTGIAQLLPSWGIRPVVKPIAAAKTQTGTDVVVADFADHPLSMPLKGCRLVLEKPLAFDLSAVADGAQGVDRFEFVPLAMASQVCVAAAVQRGASARKDIAIRPMRIVAVGDSTFVINSQLKSRANANRDFFINAVSYLSGAEPTADGRTPGVVSIGVDRELGRHYLLAAGVIVPLFVLFLMTAVVLRRRFRR